MLNAPISKKMVFCQISLENNIENELIAGQTVSGIIDIQLRQKLDVKRKSQSCNKSENL